MNYLAGDRGVPNPPNIHWTEKVKRIQKRDNSTWANAVKQWKDEGKPQIPLNQPNKTKPVAKPKPVIKPELNDQQKSPLYERHMKKIQSLKDDIKKTELAIKKQKEKKIDNDPFLIGLESDLESDLIRLKNASSADLNSPKIIAAYKALDLSYILEKKENEIASLKNQSLKGKQKRLSKVENEKLKNLEREAKATKNQMLEFIELSRGR